MPNFKKGLSLILALLMIFSSLSVAAFAQTDDIIYTVATYFMDTTGKYSSVPSIIDEFYASVGETISLNPEQIEGFTFDNSKSSTEFTVKEDGTSEGKIYYSRNKYNATYYYEDLLGPQTEKSSVYYGAAIPSFEANPSGKPAKQGYNFIMWSLDGVEKITVPATMPANDVDMYPIYEIKTYTYTFDAGNGGRFSNGEQTISVEYKFGDVPEFPDENPTMDHMEFIDWDNNLPETVVGNLTFNALYNEMTYAAIFMDGDEEIGYLDGYYYGDFIDEEDIPEGYDSWTLSDGTYVEFPYEITRNIVFYAAEAPSYYTATFYLDDEKTDWYEEFSILQGDEIDFPADPEKEGYIFTGWNPEITSMPANDVDFIAVWDAKSYNVVFDTNGAAEIEPIVVTFGEKITLPQPPERDGFVFLGWDGMPADGFMPAKNITLTAKWEKTISENYLSFKTEIYSFDETSGEWVVADKVERGETVKARIFIETGFAVGTGQVLCFYNEDVFESKENMVNELVVNNSPTSTTAKYRVSGNYLTPSKSHDIFTDLVYFDYISEEFLEKHTPLTFTFSFAAFKCHAISGDEWFAEFDLVAKEDAAGTGDFFIVPETIVNSENGYFAYINLSKGIEDGSSRDAESMISWNPDSNVESHPVSTGYGRINLDANGGVFDSSGNDKYVVDLKVNEPVIIETPVRNGYKFNGWNPELPAVMSEKVMNSSAIWEASTDTPYKIVAHYYDFTADDSVYSSKEFEYTGVTGYDIKIVENIPEKTDENTYYILLSDFNFDYNILDSENENNAFSSYIKEDGTTVIDLYFIPVTHVVIFDSNSGSFVDGDAVKFIEVPHGSLANDFKPYSDLIKSGYKFNGWYGMTETSKITSDVTFKAEWIANKYNAIFDANGGKFSDGSSEITNEFDYESVISSPDETPVKSGFAFIGWKDNNGFIYNNGSNLGVMPLDGKTFTAEWVEIIKNYEAVFNANGGKFADGKDSFMIIAKEGEEIILPSPEDRSGYTFEGWLINDECFAAGDKFTMPASNVVFTAEWNEIPVETTTEEITTVPVTTEPVTEPVTEPTTKPVTVPTTESTTSEPVTEPTTIPTTESTTSEPITEPTTKPVTVPTTESTTSEPVTEPTTKPVTVPTTESTTSEPVTEPTTVPTTVHTHKPKTIVVNATCEKSGEKYEVCSECGIKLGNSTVIPALGHSAGNWQTIKEATYESEGKKVKKCTRKGCEKILEEAVIPVLKPEKVDLSIKTPSITTIKYGDSIYLHAIVELPVGAKVVWESNNGNFSYTVSTDTKTCLITPSTNGETEFTAKVVDSAGNIISDVCTQKMTSKAGFFQKILAFFKRLFGLTKTYPEMVIKTYDK